MEGSGFLQVTLSAESHESLALSCADKLLWFFADQVLREPELAIAYPCLNCRGGLSVFLAYLALAIEENPPGRSPEPVLVYPGTPDIREAYTGLKVRVGDLLDTLRQRRIRAKRECFIHPWELNVLRKIRRGAFDRTALFPLHDFFPAAVLEADGSPRIFAGRDGFGKGDDAPPPLQFTTKILRVSGRVRYRATVIMHDAIESASERERQRNLDGIHTRSLVHLFESPYAPTFRRIMTSGRRYWRIKPDHFVSDGSPVAADAELRRMLAAERRVHRVPSPLLNDEHHTLDRNFRDLRQMARESPEVAAACTRLHSCYRLMLTLPVPTEDYDVVANEIGSPSLSERIDGVMDIAEAVGPGVAYALIDESVQVLRSVLDRLEADPARARAVLVEVRRASREGKRIGVVVSSPVFASAIERYLAHELNCEPLTLPDLGIHMTEARSLAHAEPFDILVFFGYRGPWVLRWMMSGRAREMVAVLTEYERCLAARDHRAGTVGRDSWKPRRTGSPEPAGDGAEGPEAGPAIEEQEGGLGEVLGEPGRDVPELPLEDEDFVRELLEDVRSPGEGPGRTAPGATVRTCRRVIFGDRYAFLPAEGSVTVLGAKGAIEKRVQDLAVGDVVLFVNGDQRRSIYEVMLAEIKKSPAFSLSADIIQAWHRRLKAELAGSGVTGADLHRRLRDAGSNVVAATVGAWLRGGVMSPQDAENLGRLFRVLGIPDPDRRHSGRIDQAARHLRNVYRQYAKAVNAFLLRSAGDDRPELDALLEKYNLDIEGVREAVIAREVEAIVAGTIAVAASIAGRLHER